jgi:hypothetical protein
VTGPVTESDTPPGDRFANRISELAEEIVRAAELPILTGAFLYAWEDRGPEAEGGPA